MNAPGPIRECARVIKQRLSGVRRSVCEYFGSAAYTPKPSLNELDDKLKKYLDFRGGVFIEAGANDGVTQSNTYHLEKGKLWTGLLVEAIPELYQKCRAERKKSRVYNCGLVSPARHGTTLKIHFANLMSVAEGAMPTDQIQEHIRLGLECQSIERSYEVEVPAVTLASLIEECGLQRIDFLSLDVEGGEAGVLEGLNLQLHRPRFILVEARYFDEVNALLTANDYRLLEQLTFHDFLYADGRLETR